MPLVRGEVDRVHDEVFTEMTYHAAYEPQRAIRTERWKYIRRFDDYPRPVLANCDDSASKDLLVEQGWADAAGRPPRSSTTWCSTRTRAATSPATPPTSRSSPSSRTGSTEWMRERDDPLLQGDVAPPPGAEINLPTRCPRTSPTGWRAGRRRRHPAEAAPGLGGVGRLEIPCAVLEPARSRS